MHTNTIIQFLMEEESFVSNIISKVVITISRVLKINEIQKSFTLFM